MKKIVVLLFSFLFLSCVKFPPVTPETYDVVIVTIGDGVASPAVIKGVKANTLCDIFIVPGVGSHLHLVTVNGVDIKAPKVSASTSCSFYAKSDIKMIVVFEKDEGSPPL